MSQLVSLISSLLSTVWLRCSGRCCGRRGGCARVVRVLPARRRGTGTPRRMCTRTREWRVVAEEPGDLAACAGTEGVAPGRSRARVVSRAPLPLAVHTSKRVRTTVPRHEPAAAATGGGAAAAAAAAAARGAASASATERRVRLHKQICVARVHCMQVLNRAPWCCGEGAIARVFEACMRGLHMPDMCQPVNTAAQSAPSWCRSRGVRVLLFARRLATGPPPCTGCAVQCRSGTRPRNESKIAQRHQTRTGT